MTLLRKFAIWKKRRQLQECCKNIDEAIALSNRAVAEQDADALRFAKVMSNSQLRLHGELREELAELEKPDAVRRGAQEPI